MLLSVFSHYSFIHLALNMYVLYNFVPITVNKYMGPEQVSLYFIKNIFKFMPFSLRLSISLLVLFHPLQVWLIKLSFDPRFELLEQ